MPLVVLALPVLDTAAAIVRRTRAGKKFYEADRGHFHHQLIFRFGLNVRQAVLLIYALCLVLGVVALVRLRRRRRARRVSVRPLRVMTVMGTRPDTIKMAPVVLALRAARPAIEPIVCVTAQHREMLDEVLRLFEIVPDVDLDIMTKTQSLTDITTRVLIGMERALAETRPDVVLVHGDTTTSSAAALAAFYQKIPVGHVEAGLRTSTISRALPRGGQPPADRRAGLVPLRARPRAPRPTCWPSAPTTPTSSSPATPSSTPSWPPAGGSATARRDPRAGRASTRPGR